MVDRIPTKTEIFDVVEAQAETLENISERIVKIEELTNKQESRNQNVIYAVLVAAILVLVSVAIETMYSKNSDNSRFDNYFEKREQDRLESLEKFNDLEKADNDIRKEMELLKAKNSYLK